VTRAVKSGRAPARVVAAIVVALGISAGAMVRRRAILSI
jgi:hypothetical protein